MKLLNIKLPLYFGLIITGMGFSSVVHAIDVILPRGNSLSKAAAVYNDYISNPEWRELYGKAARKAIDADVFAVVNEKVFSKFNSDAQSLLASSYGISFRFPQGTLAVEKAEIYGKILSDIQAGKDIGASDKTGRGLGLNLGYFRGPQAYASLVELFQDKEAPQIDYLSRVGVNPTGAFSFDKIPRHFTIDLTSSVASAQSWWVNENILDPLNAVNSSKVRVARVVACKDSNGKDLDQKCLDIKFGATNLFEISLEDNSALAAFASTIPPEGLKISKISFVPETSSFSFEALDQKFEIPATAEIAVITGEGSMIPANVWLTADDVAQMEQVDFLSQGKHNIWISSPKVASAAVVHSDARLKASLKAAEVAAMAKQNEKARKRAQVILGAVERQAALDALERKKLEEKSVREEEARQKKIVDDILKEISLSPIQLDAC